MKKTIAPLREGRTDIEDYRNVAQVDGLYVCNERAGAGMFYAILGGEVNFIPLVRTRRHGHHEAK